MHDMETVVIVAISVLCIIFLVSLVVIILVCRHKYCRQFDLSAELLVDAKTDIQLIREATDFELDDVRLRPDVERLLADDQWIDDATGLIPHCLAILKKCRHLTESLVAMTMRNVSKYSQQQLHEIIDIAKKIGPRIDDVVQSMYPPLDARLLEARSVALILSVTHLALITRTICQIHSAIDWIEDALVDMEKHVQILREAGLAMEIFNRSQTNCTSLEQQQSTST